MPTSASAPPSCHHNDSALEVHEGREVRVTRTGAIRAGVGDLGVTPGSMGTSSFLVEGLGNPASHESCSHGAGRRMSRTQARTQLSPESLAAAMGDRAWLADRASSLVDEHPDAHKDTGQAMRDQADLVTVRAELRQVLNSKGRRPRSRADPTADGEGVRHTGPMEATDDPVDRAPDAAAAGTDPEGPARRGDLDGDGHLDARERFGVLREAAIQAELDTGRHEETEAEAKRNVVLRMATIIIGFVVLLGGFAMMILPGPGILGIIAGLGILSRELVWAERMLEYAKEKARVDELKEQPKWVQVVAWTITIGAIGASLWYVFLADPKPELAAALPWNWG